MKEKLEKIIDVESYFEYKMLSEKKIIQILSFKTNKNVTV